MAKVFVCDSCGAQVTIDGDRPSYGKCPGQPQGFLDSSGHRWSQVGTTGGNADDGSEYELSGAGGEGGWAAYIVPAVFLLVLTPFIASVLDAVLIIVFGVGGEDGVFSPIVDAVLDFFFGD